MEGSQWRIKDNDTDLTYIIKRKVEAIEIHRWPYITDLTGSKFYMLGNRDLSSAHFTRGKGTQYWLDALPISEDGSIHAHTTNRSKNVIIAENTGTSVHRPEYVAKSDIPGIGLLETDGNADENFHIRVNEGKLHIGPNNDSFNAFRSKITVQQDGKVGVGTSSPVYELDVEGAIQAHEYFTGDIIFQKDGKKLWRMFEDENGVYLKKFSTGKVSKVFLESDLVEVTKELDKQKEENKVLQNTIQELMKTISSMQEKIKALEEKTKD